MWSQCKALPCAALSRPILTLQYCHLPQCASKAVAVLCHKFSCLNDIVFFFSCQVRLRGPKLLEHSLATMWHHFESFPQFLFTDTTGSTTNQCKIQSVCTATVHDTQNHCPPHKHKYKKLLHILHQACALLTFSCRRWTQMSLTTHVWWSQTALFYWHYLRWLA